MICQSQGNGAKLFTLIDKTILLGFAENIKELFDKVKKDTCTEDWWTSKETKSGQSKGSD